MYSFWQMVAETPWWIYVIVALLIKLGIDARQPRTLHVAHLFIGPLAMIPCMLFIIYHFIVIKQQFILLACGAFLISFPLGWLQFYFLKVRALPNQAKLYFPGTWTVLLLVPALFLIKYYFRHIYFFDPAEWQNGKLTPLLYILYGFTIGLTLGRFLFTLRRLKHGPFVTDVARSVIGQLSSK